MIQIIIQEKNKMEFMDKDELDMFNELANNLRDEANAFAHTTILPTVSRKEVALHLKRCTDTVDKISYVFNHPNLEREVPDI